MIYIILVLNLTFFFLEEVNRSDLKGLAQYSRYLMIVVLGKQCDLHAFSPLAEMDDRVFRTCEEEGVRGKNTFKFHPFSLIT